jgi:protein-S-isoprenylcysteine O-methyltransferase Ste14|tara:strand:- start:6147 stop:6542 length:396 start_codon:yes stop_codon:yes gene_type:complete
MFALHRLLPLYQWLDWPWRALGWLPVLLGLGMVVSVAITFKRAKTNLHPFGEPDKLVTGGLFALSRNPIYLGFATALLGGVVLAGSLTPLLGPLVFWLVADRWYIRFEETKLLNNFAGDYQAYCRRTRRWI